MAARIQKGKVVIISSPSGGGKTSICRRLLTPAMKRAGWQFSVSYTTRTPRRGEKNGREYFFVEPHQFDSMARSDAFAESASVHIYKYGTPRGPIDQVRNRGGVMVLDVDVQGARSLKKAYPDAIAIFILPPSIRALRSRLRKRGTETAEQLRIRYETARKEMRNFTKYNFDYIVINKELTEAVNQVKAIVEAHPCRIEQIDRERIKKITG